MYQSVRGDFCPQREPRGASIEQNATFYLYKDIDMHHMAWS